MRTTWATEMKLKGGIASDSGRPTVIVASPCFVPITNEQRAEAIAILSDMLLPTIQRLAGVSSAETDKPSRVHEKVA